MLLKAVLENDLEKVKNILDEDTISINQIEFIEGTSFCAPITPLILATNQNHVEIISLLLSYGADVNFPLEGGKTAIFYGKNKQVASLLVEHGADIEAYCNEDRYNPVMLMLMRERLEAADYLLSLGSFPKHWSQYCLRSVCEEHIDLISRYYDLDERVAKKEDVTGFLHMFFDYLK